MPNQTGASSASAICTAGQCVIEAHLCKWTFATDVPPALWTQMYVRPFGVTECGDMDSVFVQSEDHQIVRRCVFNFDVRMNHGVSIAHGFDEAILQRFVDHESVDVDARLSLT